MSEVWFRAILIIVCSILGSGGFWTFLQIWFRRRDIRKSAQEKFIMGLAYREITTIGLKYIDRGWITSDEYQDLLKYFYEPYKALGGNGAAERTMNQVRNLPIRSHPEHAEIFRNREEGWVNHVRVIAPEEHGSAAGR